MSLEERLHRTDRKTLYGYSQAAEWCNPQLRRILRCPCCDKIVNANGIAKAIRTHLRQTHQSLMQNPILTQVQKMGGKKQEFAIPVSYCTRQQKKPTMQVGKQRPRMLPAPLPREKLRYPKENGNAEGEKEDLEFDGVDQMGDLQQKETDPVEVTEEKGPQQTQVSAKQPMSSTTRPSASSTGMQRSRGRDRMRPGLDEATNEDTDAFESDEERTPSQGGFSNSTTCANTKHAIPPNKILPNAT